MLFNSCVVIKFSTVFYLISSEEERPKKPSLPALFFYYILYVFASDILFP